ncbi:hypothetical protein H5410_013179 [Solanum commersonii]|uniref:Uncharacterized protein n=1 Tax=Solanum commersonii TaxID=4109 RepID=A0A9J6AUD9_SOLCO|nr:hypothetical protein H5410_013179 [Solanum commersonii]
MALHGDGFTSIPAAQPSDSTKSAEEIIGFANNQWVDKVVEEEEDLEEDPEEDSEEDPEEDLEEDPKEDLEEDPKDPKEDM